EGGGAVCQSAFSPDGRLLAVAVDPNGVKFNRRRQGQVQLWDVKSRRRLGRPIVPGGGAVFSLAFSRDGSLLATGSGGRLDLWDVATQAHHGKPMRVAGDGVPSVAFDQSGRLVAGGGAAGRGRTLGPRYGSRLRRGAHCKGPAPLTHTIRRPSVPRAAECLQPRREAAGRPRSRDPRDAVGRRPGRLAAQRLRDRGPELEPRGVEAVPATWNVFSRDLPGVASRLTLSLGQADPCRTVKNCSLDATNVGLPGGSHRKPATATLLLTVIKVLQEGVTMR